MFDLWHKIMKKLYDWAMRVVAGPKAFVTLCVMAFAESSFFPIPPDILMIPLVLKRRTEAFKIALWYTVWSVIGGAFGYAIGHFLYDWSNRNALFGFLFAKNESTCEHIKLGVTPIMLWTIIELLTRQSME